MLRHHIRIQRRRIATDFDLHIAGRVTSVERAEERKKSLHNGLAAGQPGEVDSKFPARGSEIENAVLR